MPSTTQWLRAISLSSSVCYVGNLITILMSDALLYNEVANSAVPIYAISLIILVIFMSMILLCDLVIICNTLVFEVFGHTWFIEVHTRRWQLLCFAKVLSLSATSAMLIHICLVLNIPSTLVYGSICLFNALLHLLFLLAVYLISTSHNASDDEETRSHHAEDIGSSRLQGQLHFSPKELNNGK